MVFLRVYTLIHEWKQLVSYHRYPRGIYPTLIFMYWALYEQSIINFSECVVNASGEGLFHQLGEPITIELLSRIRVK